MSTEKVSNTSVSATVKLLMYTHRSPRILLGFVEVSTFGVYYMKYELPPNLPVDQVSDITE